MNDTAFGFGFEPRNAFTDCQSLSEVLIVAHSLAGLDAVAEIIAGAQRWRESLREAADEFRELGLLDLSSLCRKAARRAEPEPIESRPWPERRALRQKTRD